MTDHRALLVASLRSFADQRNIAACERLLRDSLARLPDTPFHKADSLTFQGQFSPAYIAADFDRFFDRQMKRFTVAVVFAEVNTALTDSKDFYYGKSAYRSYGGTGDLGWLAGRDGRASHHHLSGMHRLAQSLAGKKGREPANREAAEIARLFVLVRFWQLVEAAVPLLKKLHRPLLIGGHERDIVLEFRPGA